MRKVFINKDNLSLDEIDYEVIRVKSVILNSRNEVLLIFNNNTYQFPGGHKKDGEDIKVALQRELKEELGVDINVDGEPFMLITTYHKNYFGTGSKVCSKIYYYLVHSDLEPNFDEIELTEFENRTDFITLRVNKDELDKFLYNAIESGRIDTNIGREMLYVSNEFNPEVI